MQKAFDYELKFDKQGRPERRFSVGQSVIWALVALILGLAGKSVVLPPIQQLIGK